MPMGIGLGIGVTRGGGVGWWQSGSALDLYFAESLGFNSIDRTKTTPDSILTYTSPSPKLVYGDDGVLRYAPHNLFLNSGAPATQNVTLITGFSYTVTVTGSGSLAGSSGASGTASAGSPATFVATGTTGTFTLTGSLTTIQINRSPAHAGYIPTTSAAVYSLPIDHDPITFEPLGVLIEEQRTNLLTYSEQFDNAAWTKQEATVSANTSSAPNGTTTADTLVSSTSGGTGYARCYASVTVTAVPYTYSVYAKAGTANFVYFITSGFDAGADGTTWFNLATGAVGTTSANHTNASIQSVGNGWYRCNFTFSTVTDLVGLIFTGMATADNTSSVNRDGTVNILLWGAQLEAGAFPTSYIPTVASQVTRAADQVIMATSAFAFNALEGTLVGEASWGPGSGVNPNSSFVAAFSEATSAQERIILYNIGGEAGYVIQDGGVTQAAYNSPDAIPPGVFAKLAVAYKENDTNGAVDGVAGSTDISCTMPVILKLTVGASQLASIGHINGHIKRLTYFPTRRTNAELQVLST